MSVFKGVGVALITPFDNGGINFDVFGRIIDYVTEGGADAICVCGTTGEPPTMSAEEKQSAIKFAIKKAAGRLPVIAGCGCNSTEETIKNALEAEALGADALLIVTPYYNKCTQAGIIAHYSAVAEKVNVPIIMYNVPSRTGVNILPETALKLSGVKKHSRHKGSQRQRASAAGAVAACRKQAGRLSRGRFSHLHRHDAGS